MLKLFIEGGFIMYPLLICSIIIWAVVIEKVLFIRQLKKELSFLYDKAGKLLSEQKINEAKGIAHSINPLLCAPYMTILEKGELSDNDWEERIHRRLTETGLGVKRYLWALGTISSSAPFIGLFGTIVGIMSSFDDIAKAGKGGFAIVAAGLSEALIATAAGIIVAVMAVIFYNYFINQLKIFNVDFKNKIFDLKDLM
jgi:biopolymer transport protein ExbB